MATLVVAAFLVFVAWRWNRWTETAAWVQAIGSLIIIAVTAMIANRQIRETRLKDAQAQRLLQESVASIAVACYRCFHKLSRASENNVVSNTAFFPSEFEAIRSALAVIRMISLSKQAVDNPNPALLAMPDFEERKAYVEVLVHNFEENMHKHREDRLLPFIRRMLDGDTAFYDDMNDMITFMDSLSAQYFRTKAMRDRYVERTRASSTLHVPTIDLAKMWMFMAPMLAINVGGNMFKDRRDYRLLVVQNDTGTPFITGDQPLVNLLVEDFAFNRGPPDELEYYYPLSPTKAMLYVRRDGALAGQEPIVDLTFVQRFNGKIVGNHNEQLISDRREVLDEILAS